MNSQSIPDVLTLFDVVRHRASAASGIADAPAFTYLDDGDHVSGTLSYAELDLAARKLAARLQTITKPGDRVLLVYPPSLDYIVAFYGCVYAGVTAVPALPPANRRTLPRLRLMAADSQPTAALTLARIRDSVTTVEEGDPNDDILRQLSWLSTDDADGDESTWVPPAAQASDIVFLQYTSGSTGAPKGVMVAHHNLLANLRLFRQMFDVRSGETFVFWLPPHHDFGLIGAIIMPVFAGAHSVQFPPAAFMMSPVRWLRLISSYRARLTGAPNFAFQLCVDKISDAQMRGLDLGCLDVAMNGAERIRYESVTQFADRFAAYGFRRESMMPSYGMAEFVLLATANMHRAADTLPNVAHISKAALEDGRVVPSDRPNDAVHIVSVGRTHEDLHDMAVVDPVTLERQSERQIGEVWLCGPAVTQGYWGLDDTARKETFHARIKGDEREWLRTGDVGFVSEGELFITGRSKELMIFGGRNIYPQDVEITVERASLAFRANGCAAFSLEDGDTAQLVIVQEVESRRRLETQSLIARLRADIAEQHEIFDLAAVVLVRPGHLPRTSSGKIQRVRCRQMYLAGEFDSIWSWCVEQEDAPTDVVTLPQTSTEVRLLALWRELFDNPALSMLDNFFRLGGHSLLAAQLVAAVGTEFRVDLPLRALFEAPNVMSLASVIDTLGSRQAGGDELFASPQHSDLPLSFVQQRFWFLDQYQPANAFYAVPVAMRLSGELVLPALRQALDAMVQRHAALRTVFPVADGVPSQQVLPALSWPLQVSDVGDLAADSIDTQIRQVMMEEARKPFDLARGPLIRAHLLNSGTELHVLLLTLHHIVHDGWSVSVLIDELAQTYAACKADQSPALPALPVSYADYTQWERRRYGEQNIQTHLAYWVEHLRGASPLLALPTDRPRPALMSHRGATHAAYLPADLVRRLTVQASQRNATLFMALTSAVQILLHRYCSQDDICMSMLSANRPAKTENVIGAFVNVVPLRAQFRAGQTFADVLAAATQEVLSAYEQQLPFELILNRLARERHAAYTPYAQVVVNFHSELEKQGRARQHRLDQSLQFDGRWAAGVAHTAFDLLLDVRERQGGLDVVFEYSTDLFDAASIQRWETHLRHVLDGMAESFDTRVDEFALLDAAERELILETFNATAQTWQAASLVHQLFETTVQRQPDAVALVSADEQLSYRSLNQRANQLAHALIAHGIRPDDRIALCVERSAAMVVGLLGILKAGGAYVPVDPDYPPERVSYMLTDSQPRLLLSSSALRDRLPAIEVPVLWLDNPSSLSTQPDHDPDPHALGLRPDHLAYVIYTSGSTGQPKGAMNQHDGVVNRLLWAQQQFALDANDRVLQKTPYAFDVSVWEFFLPLLAGAQLVLSRPGGHQSPAYLRQLIADTGITVAHFVPSMLQVFLDQGDLSGCARMRHVLCSGEALPPALQNRFLQKLPGVALHNLYGPTEAAVDVTWWPCTEPGAVVPIGYPIANTRLYVLDARMQPVPIGVAGELYIGGVQVGRGYLHRPVLTEERFVANPFGSGRLYKTGDLGRWRADGAIEYLGRNDFQVKLRGFRIELGEIEARLLEHPAIREAVVIAREETSGDKRLVAYVVQNQQDQSEDARRDDNRATNRLLADLRARLSGQLPDYMLPSAFVVLDALPLTPSGKLDRRALPAPDRDAVVTRQYEAPQGETEHAIAAIWSGLLGVSPIGRHDHFFELGGHSLLATQVAAKLRASLSVDVPLKALFEYSTLATLAAHIQVAPHDADSDVPLPREERPSATPASFAQQRLWFIEQLGRGQPVYIMTHAVRLRGELDIHALQASLMDLVARQESLRTHFAESGGIVMQQVVDASPLTLHMIDLSSVENGTPQTWIDEAAHEGFDLRTQPLIRFALLQEHAAQHVLLITAHHVIADGWSLGILNRELSALYNAHRQGQSSPLCELPLQYADFAHWQRRRDEQGAFEQQLAYWQARLQDAPAALPLPTDHPRPAVPSHRGGIVRCVVPAAITHRLKLLVQQAEASLFMGLATALAALLSRYAGQSDICIGTPVANRQHVALDDVIGFFVNTLVLRIDADGGQSADGLLQHVRDIALDAYANQDVPFNHVVASLDRARHDLHSPLFQVMLVLQNASADDLALEDIEAEVLPVHNGTAKFDLTVAVTETRGELACEFEYSADLFEHGTIERMARLFVEVLRGMTADPTQAVDRLPLMDEAERRRVTETFNATDAPYPAEDLIHRWLERQATAQPDAIALLHNSASLSYGELNLRANQVAHALIGQGVRPDDRVAIAMERGFALIVGLLGVLKAGGAYVPLDPAYPAERLAYMLRDSAPVALLTQSSLQERWCSSDVPMLVLGDDGTSVELAAQPSHDPVVDGLTSRHLAYVMYTSGSTGEPKGVMVEHRSVLRLTINNSFAPLTTQDVVVHAAKIAFDAATWEVWGGLLNGARVLLVDEGVLLEPVRFVRVLREAEATALFLTTALFNQYADVLAPILPQLRHLLFGGEVADLRTVRRVLTSAPPQRLSNIYGPTETTTFATVHPIEALDDAAVSLPIGGAIANTSAYILDRHGEPVPVGIMGEIYLGGPGVARGYWNRPALTAERFLRDPFADDPQARMYKTGDLGRWLANGEIEYLGRNDLQVKIRGFRIELGEIEAQLLKQANVRDALVIAREDQPGDKRLVAYLTSQDGQILSGAALRDALARELAEYMLPGAFVQLEQLPLTPNGKLDRQALPAPDRQALIMRDYQPPQGELEQTIAAVWQELLGLEQVGRHDHFFELGGHSLMIITMIERLRGEGLLANVKMVFASPCLSALAADIASHASAPREESQVPPNLIPAGSMVITPAMLPLVDLNQEAIDRIVAATPGGAASIQDIYPLSPLQEGMLFHHLLEAEGDAYLLRTVLGFAQRDRLDTFLGAMQQVVDRHDILRSAMHWQGLERPVQVVHRRATLPVEELELQDAEAELLAHTDPRRIRLDLSRAPLLRAVVAQNPRNGEWLLALLQHHTIGDHVALEIMVQEIQAILEHQPERLTAPAPYRNFIAQILHVPASVHEAYFRERLGDIEEPTCLFGVMDVHADGSAVREAQIRLDESVARRVRESARKHGVSTAVLFHVAWAQVLARCTGQDDVVFGTVLAGRSQGTEAADRTLGLFINTLPLRVALAERSVRQVVQETYHHLSALLTHEQASLALAQRCSGVAANVPLFNALLNYRHTQAAFAAETELWHGVRTVHTEERTNYPVTLSVNDLGDGFEVVAHCAGGIEPARLTGYMCTVMHGLVDALHAPEDRPMHAVSMLDAAERSQLIDIFNASGAPSPVEGLIHTLFEQQAKRQPAAIALTCNDQSLTYAQLNERANAVAHVLIAHGVKPDDRVALGVGRGLAMVVGILGILKAGAGYVPLDPAYPAERLAYLLHDSAPALLLTQASLQGVWPADLRTLYLEDESVFAAQPTHDPVVEGLHPQRLAYVIYTSGSTGQPKGVMVEHAQVVRLLATTEALFRFGADDVWTMFHSYAFDFSVWELWGALAYGGRLVIVPSLCARSPKDFYALLCREQVTVLNQTPSAFRALIGAQDAQPHRLRYVIFGGEALELHTLVPWIERNDPEQTRLVNMYGITETTVHVTYRALTREDIEAGRGSLIGRSLPDLRVYLLDRHGEPVPVGVPGEIHVGGAGVTRGYWNRAELTAERFLPDPFVDTTSAGARMYKSGDLGRWLPNGDIEYLGRNDFQVKIRGFRIELGEIEAKLVKQVGVRDAVVIAREDVPGDKRLVAYFTAQDGQALSTAALRDALAKELADYMLPSAFVQLEQLPLTAHGKLDSRALPAPDANAVASRIYEAPLGETERRIAAIWQELLGLERVGRHDHFFALGGHSLMIVTMIERLRGEGLAASVKMIFASPSLAALAADIAAHAMQAGDELPVPSNLIPADSVAITPAMLPLVELTQEAIDRILAVTPGGVANVQDIYPLSPLQEGMLFHHLLETESDAYLLQTVLAFEQRDRLDAFLGAMQQVIDRHDILRSAVHWQGLGRPVQVVHRRATLAVEEPQLPGTKDAEAELLEHTDPRRTRLDLSRAPLLRAVVAQNPRNGEWLLALLQHHVIGDHVTLEILVQEIQAILEHQPERLTTPAPYRNFIAEVLRVPVSVHEAYFRERLGDIEEPTCLFGVMDVHADGTAVREAQVSLDESLARRVRESARKHGVSTAVLFHVAWAQVLACCTGQDDVVFGTVLAGRSQGTKAADRTFGPFINTLPLRVALAGRSVRQVVRETYHHLSALLTHEQASLALAQRCSGVAANVPLFNALLNYRHTQATFAAEAELWRGVRMVHAEERNNYPVTLSVNDLGDGFEVVAHCAGGIEPARLIGYMCTVMRGLVDALHAPEDRPMHAVSLLGDVERRQVIDTFNATATPYPAEGLIHQLFEQHASVDPDAVALLRDGASLSYGELNRRANQVAHALIALGVGPDDCVAIGMERGIALVVGMLGILKAGGAYVPLDPGYPSERVAYMLRDSAPSALLTQSSLQAHWVSSGVPVLVLDNDGTSPELAAQPSHNTMVRGLDARHLAYVMYTSGSTGTPKGVMVEHRQVLRLVMQDRYVRLDAADGVAFCANPAFDAATWEIWATLLHGARLIAIPQDCLLDAVALGEMLKRHQATVLHLTAGLFHQYADALAPVFAGLNYLLFGGDKIDANKVRHVLQGTPPAHLVQCYGPTETTTFASTHEIRELDAQAHSVPIGRPIGNTRIYVLDAHGEPVPVGVTGEIHIGGDGVARGYLNRDELTQERFLRDPFHADPQARMYKTGDLGRWLQDGTLEFLGRNDFQVKIRGFRVELGEIEAQLVKQANVKDAVVVARVDASGDKRLVAYLIARDGQTLSTTALRDALATQLADYMLPSAFVQLEQFPLTPNGKLDARALPAPDASAVAARTYEAPVGEMERSIASIWQELLGLERVGRHDHFFELGGHSLMAVRVLARMRGELGVELPLRDLFAYPTLQALAQAAAGATQVRLAPIPRADRRGELPLSWAQQRLWFIHQLDPAASLAYHMPGSLRLRGQLDIDALQATFERIVARHEVLRTRFVSIEGRPVQVIDAHGHVPLLHHDLRGHADAEREAASLAQDEARAPFDLSHGPLLRTCLLQLADDDYILLLTQHHIVSDGWSVDVLMREISALYSAYRQGHADPLPALAIQYADYAVWQREEAQRALLQAHAAYWSAQLEGAPTLLTLPTDRPRPAAQSYLGDQLTWTFTASAERALRTLSQQHGTTLFMTALAAWSIVLSRWSGQGEVVIGTPVANRQRSELEPLLGFFVNTLALRIRLDDAPTVEALLVRIRSQLIEAYTHQDLPFEQLVEVLQPPRSLSHSPVFQAVLVMNNTPGAALQLPGLRMEVLEQERTTAHFDVTLLLQETEGRVAGHLSYASDLFDRSTIERMARQFMQVLQSMSAGVHQPVDRLSLLDGQERRQLLADFSTTKEVLSAPSIGIHMLFEQQAKRQPAAIALTCNDQSLTYAQLNERANAVAHVLIAHGVKPDDRVALGVGRGLAMVVGILGILKAGAGYVPLDPAYPAERLAYLLHDSAPALLLTQASLQGVWPADLRTLYLEDESVFAAQPTHDPVVEGLHPQRLAYVIYTSGSTGQPKGVMVEHAQVVRLLATTEALFRFGADDVWTMFHSYAFDFSVWELWGALAYGGRLVIVPSLCARSPKDFYALLCREQVTVLNQTPSAFRALIGAQDAQPHRLRYVIFGGEALELHTLVPWIERNDPEQTRLVNMYGITETTVHVTYRALTREDIEAGRGSLIGRSLPDLRVYLLDRHGEPVPVGVPGEIHVGGAGVTRGYWNRAELTAERFLPDPFVDTTSAGARMYKSGDLGRWLPNGDIEYLGRNDFQVKIRGFRIELGEIEAKLVKQVGVRDAVVIAREDVPGDKRLVAYFTAQDGQALSTAALRDALAKELADYMLPSAFVQLEQLPLTAHGKLDSRALPVPDQQSVVMRAYEAPRGDTEQAIAAIWQELLGLERVGRHDHFFELGGHSLLAVQMMAQLRAACRVELPLRILFDAPTLAMLAAEAERIQPQAMQAGDGIVHEDHEGALPLSFAQQRFWFLDQYQRDNTLYNVALMVNLRGALDYRALEQASQWMIERHEILRTVFASSAGVPQQIIRANLQLPWQSEDVGDGADGDARIRAALAEEIQTPFDIANGPLLRTRLLRRHAQDHVLLLATHHIVYDGWSTRILLDELSRAYAAFKAGTSVALPELLVDYADYTRWEQRRYSGDRLEVDLGYWKAQLKEAPSLLALPTDRPRQAVVTHRGASLRLHLPEPLIQRLTALANERHATLFMALTAVTQAWLHRYCGQQDMCLGVISANRPAGTEGLIGNFFNILPLTTHIGATSSFMDLVDIAAKNLLAAHDRQVPFELLLQHVLEERSSAYIPYAQVVLNFHNEIQGMKSTWSTDDALSWQLHAGDAREVTHAAFDLKLEMQQLGDGLELVLEYNTDLFDHATMACWSGHYRMLLESVCADPLGHIHQLKLLTPAEQQAFADTWRETQADYPRDTTIGELLDQQAARTPDAVAVVHRERSLSYRELRQRTDRLAAFLRNAGVGPDTLVGIYTERSIEMVLAVLAVVKAGAAYVPLDPAYPQARLEHMLSDARPPLVLAEARFVSRLEGMAPQIISVDTLEAAAVGDDIAPLPPLGTPTDLAYIIYTSGSTGRPKGAMVHRQGFVNLLHWYIRQFDICADDKVLLLSSFSFDLTQKNIFSVLLVGGQLHLPANEDALSGAADYVERHRITYLNCAPSAFYPLLADGGVRRLSSLRQVFLGGEPIRVALIHDAYRGLSQLPLIHNTYGPTEASDVVSFHTWDPRIAVSTLPIGRAIANTRLYVLDAHRQLLPQGAVGELYVGGDGVGRGYLHLAQLTQERFLPDPYSEQPNARMYRTGDVVRQLPDGEIEYLGRNDFQVKIRGFRIELGEIEAKLAACAGVREAVVIDREDVPGDKRLVAYLIAHDGQALSNAALRDSLAKELADYMLPSAFVQLEQLPLTPNGKLDRQALPAPDQQSVVTREYEAPQGEIEQAIAIIWQQLLGLERVGRHDHFFELGGHSLLATQLVSRISAAFGIGLPLRSVFEAPTLTELAACAKQTERKQDAALIPRIGRDQPLPLSFAQQRLWFLDQFESQRGIYNIPAAVRLTGSLDVDALERTLNEIVRRHEALRTSFVLAGDAPVQVIAPMLSLPLNVVDLSETQARSLMQDEASQPFDLSSGPLIRFRLIRVAAQEHILLLTVHHIVSDGWSMGVVVREVAALYPAFMQGQPSPLPDLPIHYADFAHWQRQWLSGDVLERQRHYWKQRLAGSPSLLPLPTDRPRPPNPSHAGSTVPFNVPAALVSRLQALGSPTQSTLFMVLCAAFNVLLARYADQTDICIGTPIANRNRGDIEELIGFFVNTLVLRTQVDLAGDFHTLLRQVRQHMLDAYAHQDVPFEQLVEVLQPERNTSYTPLFQVMLTLHNTPMNELALPGLSMSAVTSENATAKFDLTLSLTESKDGLQGISSTAPTCSSASTIERMRGSSHAPAADDRRRAEYPDR